MPARNGQNPIRAAKNISKMSNNANDAGGGKVNTSVAGISCPSCGTDIPPKPGFRPSSLKCPKCGGPAVKK